MAYYFKSTSKELWLFNSVWVFIVAGPTVRYVCAYKFLYSCDTDKLNEIFLNINMLYVQAKKKNLLIFLNILTGC